MRKRQPLSIINSPYCNVRLKRPLPEPFYDNPVKAKFSLEIVDEGHILVEKTKKNYEVCITKMTSCYNAIYDPFVYPVSVYPSSQLSIHPSILDHLCIHHLSIHSSIHLCVHSSIHPSIYPFNHPFIYPSIYSFLFSLESQY